MGKRGSPGQRRCLRDGEEVAGVDEVVEVVDVEEVVVPGSSSCA